MSLLLLFQSYMVGAAAIEHPVPLYSFVGQILPVRARIYGLKLTTVSEYVMPEPDLLRIKTA